MKAVLAVDGSEESRQAIEIVKAMSWPAGSVIDVITVLPTDAELLGGGPAGAYQWLIDVRGELAAATKRLVQETADAIRREGLEVTTTVVEGRAASEIVAEAERRKADMIVLGARGHGAVERAFLGSVSEEVADRAHRPVLVARGSSVGRILVSTDGSPQSDDAVAMVADSGCFAGATTRVLGVIDVPAWWLGFTAADAAASAQAYTAIFDGAEKLAQTTTLAASTRLQKAGFASEAVTRNGPAATSIVEESKDWKADLIVMGTRGQGLGKRLLLGSTSRAVLHHATASVLIVSAAHE